MDRVAEAGKHGDFPAQRAAEKDRAFRALRITAQNESQSAVAQEVPANNAAPISANEKA